ncbi:FMN-binding protein [Erysipelothrix larvae]|nr:FMN-binding protein [Erysipelothrix larvae]
MATNILPVDSVAMSLVNDGTYHGNSNNGLIEVEVEVTVSNHEITKIDIIKHNNGLGSKAEKITQNIISEQSLEVDTIASATYSSNTILKAVENALLKGK